MNKRKNEQPPSLFLERPLPHAEEAERAILGGVQLRPLLAHEVFAVLEPDDFYSPLHRRVATAIKALHKSGKKIDPIMIGEEIKKDGAIESIGGVSTIANLTHGLPHFDSLKLYIDLVREKSLARQTIRRLQNAVQDLLDEETEAGEIVARTAKELINLQGGTHKNTYSLTEVGDEVRTTFETWESGNLATSSVPCGLPEVDRKLRLNGFAMTELTLIAARPSQGKTALLLQSGTHAVKLPEPVPSLFVSLEMHREKLVMRMLPSVTNIPNRAINPTTLRNMPDERHLLHTALDTFTYPLYFDRSFNIDKLIANAEYYIQTRGVKLVMFDYLTLIKNGVVTYDSYDRVSNIGDITNALKELATRTNTAVVGAAQLNRAVEKEYRKPRMDDLRDSGEIEQAADVILFPYDPDAKYHAMHPDSIRDEIWLDIYCAKQREGERGWSVPVKYDKNMQTFATEDMLGIEKPRRMAPAPAVPNYVDNDHDDDDDDDRADYDPNDLPNFN